jgi:hypothetical protein
MIGGDAETLHAGTIVIEQCGFLFQRKAGEQIVHPALEGKIGLTPGGRLLAKSSNRNEKEERNEAAREHAISLSTAGFFPSQNFLPAWASLATAGKCSM